MNLPGASSEPTRRLLRLGRGLSGALLFRIGIGVGLVAGPVLFTAHARPSRGGRGVQSDVLPSTPAPAKPADDLLLQKAGERMAEALAHFSEGLAAEDRADNERALEAYRHSLSLDPGNTELAVKIAFELARRGEVPEGISVLKDAAKAAPKDPLAPLFLSQLYGKFLKKPDLAERYALAALTIDPNQAAPYLALFEIYMAGGEKRKAAALLERAARSSSREPQFWVQIGELETKSALREKSIPPETLKKLDALFQKALAHAGDEPEWIVKTADLYVMTRQVKEAIPLYEKAIAASADPKGEETVAVRGKLASAYLAEGRKEEAIATLEALIKDSPTRYEAYEMLGELYALGGQLHRAIVNYQQALLIDSSQPKNFQRIASLQLQDQKPKDAIKTLLDARARFPGLAQLTYALALSFLADKESVKALTAFDEALYESQRTGEAIADGAFYFQYGVAAEQAGHLDKAVEMLKKSIQLDPTNAANACNYLGYMWADRGIHLEEALELIGRALALEPDNGAYLDSLGWCQFKLGRNTEALAALQKAVERVEPPDPVVFDHLGDVQAALGDRAAAEGAWQKALSLDPENHAIQKKLHPAAANASQP